MSEPVMWRTPPRHGSFMAGQAPAHAHRRPTRWLALCAALAFLAFASTLARAQSDAAVLQAIESPRAATSLLLDVARAGERLVVVGDRGHILYSDDDGGRWVQARVPTRQMLTSVYFVDDRHGWAVGHDAQILATTDGGATWRRQFEDRSREAPLLGVWFRDLQTGYAVGAYGALLETTDGGQHWQDVGDRLDNQDGYHLNAIAAVEGAGLFIVGEMGILFRSTDWGHTWVSVESPYEGSLFGVLATGEPHTLLVYGLRGHLFRSEDFGDSWTRVAWGGGQRHAPGVRPGRWRSARRWRRRGGRPWRHRAAQ